MKIIVTYFYRSGQAPPTEYHFTILFFIRQRFFTHARKIIPAFFREPLPFAVFVKNGSKTYKNLPRGCLWLARTGRL